MNLTDFENYLDPVLLKRGQQYYRDGRVIRIEKTVAGWAAVVAGNDDYRVETQLDETGRISYTYCDCPYVGGEFCKHQAAVFYALRAAETTEGPAGQEPVTTSQPEGLEAVVAGLDHTQLMKIVLELGNQYEEIGRTLLFKYGVQSDEIKTCRKMMRAYIQEAKRNGFIDWRRAAHAAKGIDLTLEKAQLRMDQGHHNLALGLGLAALAIAVDTLSYCDDSDGWMGTAVSDSLDMIDDTMQAGAQCLEMAEKKKMLAALIKEARHQRYDGWSDWRIKLLGSGIYFCSDPGARRKVENELDLLLEALTEDGQGSRDYGIGQIKLLQLQIIECFDDPHRAQEFITANIQYSGFRRKAIDNAISQKDYEQVLRLCQAGEEADVDYRGLVLQWRRYRYYAYEQLGDIDKQRELALELVNDGDYDYYGKLKALYPPSQWPAMLETILDEFQKRRYLPGIYVQILIEEDLPGHILGYCRREPAAILKLYEYLLPDYVDDVNALFRSYIERAAREADQRSKYKQICSLIKIYKKACGDLAARRIIEDMRRTYPRRPAFLDELGKI